MKKIAVTGGKGGTGKSTVATAIAVELARNYRVLLTDADSDCPNDHLILSVKRKKDSDVHQLVPKWDMSKCIKCGKCAAVCKQDSIAFVRGRYPAFVPDTCTGCGACIVACPTGAISEGRKKIGTVYTGRNYGVDLVSGELKIGEMASGEIVVEVKKRAQAIAEKLKSDFVLTDSAAGIGCPVIASINGSDFVVAVTEPTPSALHDLKRVLHITDQFTIPKAIVINKSDLNDRFRKKIKAFARERKIPVIGEIPYRKSAVERNVNMMPVNAEEGEMAESISLITEKLTGLLGL
ncbi:MAG: ATP-binding protein [Candidatus Aenigmarchaeota archaeon]|nr:ATP-binding protein [Candidatus Aenigmarchaeota archaeon]